MMKTLLRRFFRMTTQLLSPPGTDLKRLVASFEEAIKGLAEATAAREASWGRCESARLGVVRHDNEKEDSTYVARLPEWRAERDKLTMLYQQCREAHIPIASRH